MNPSKDQPNEQKPSHYQNMANYKPIKKTVNVRLVPSAAESGD